jgi:hypothetical protein
MNHHALAAGLRRNKEQAPERFQETPFSRVENDF